MYFDRQVPTFPKQKKKTIKYGHLSKAENSSLARLQKLRQMLYAGGNRQIPRSQDNKCLLWTGKGQNAEFKNPWSYTSTKTYALMVCCLIKQSDIFTFYYLATTDPSFYHAQPSGSPWCVCITFCTVYLCRGMSPCLFRIASTSVCTYGPLVDSILVRDNRSIKGFVIADNAAHIGA